MQFNFRWIAARWNLIRAVFGLNTVEAEKMARVLEGDGSRAALLGVVRDLDNGKDSTIARLQVMPMVPKLLNLVASLRNRREELCEELQLLLDSHLYNPQQELTPSTEPNRAA